MDEQSYRDHCLIVVGGGTAAEETLCKRRLAVGGAGSVLLMAASEGSHDELRQTPGSVVRTYWTKTGPDAVELQAQQQLVIFRAAGKMRHVQILDNEWGVQAEMSGYVVLNPDMELAQELDVEVKDPDLMACGTFSWRHMLLSMALLLVWHVARWAISIYFEKQAHEGQLPWWRGGLVWFNGMVFCCWALFEIWAASLAAERSTWLTWLTGQVLGVSLAVGATWRQVADFPMSLLGVGGNFLTGPTLLYYLTRARHETCRFIPCLMWTVAQLCGTVGCCIVLAGMVVTYLFLLADGQVFLATAFLPVSTALTETSTVFFTKLVYSRLVVAKRPQVPGDTAYQAMPFMLIAAHAFSEAARLVAVFGGAVNEGSWSWLGGTVYRGQGAAVAVFAPTGWSKLHDELKISGGYFRFIALIGLVIARYMMFGELVLDGPKAPGFNPSAACALLVLLMLEILEDNIVLRELLPMAPLPLEFIEAKDPRAKPDPGNLISVEVRPSRSPISDPWRLNELNNKGERRATNLVPTVPDHPPELTDRQLSLGPRHPSIRSRIRQWFGQQRAVIPALTLVSTVFARCRFRSSSLPSASRAR
ncbi:unnamed protein product [Symbiodinium sp. CCMP2456]|nr:unnamed protein product [Symbiodinium sp. CCMP2456]